MNLKELLAKIEAGLAQLNAKKDAGEDVGELIATLEKHKSETEAKLAAEGGSKGSGLDELTALRAEKREREEREVAARAAEAAVKGIVQEDVAREERMEQYAQEAVAKAIGGLSEADRVEQLLKGIRGSSRFAGEGAADDAIKAIAGMGGQGTALTVQDPGSMKAGEVRGVKEIREGKNLAHFMSMIGRMKNVGEFGLKEEELAFLRESQQKAMSEGTDSAGGFLVHPEWMPDILSLLRASAVVRASGPRIVPFSKIMYQTSVSSGATAYYTTENAHIQKSEMTVADATLLTPKNLTGLVPVSNYLLSDAPESDGLVRSDLIEVMALREDLAFLQGSGLGGEPTGMKVMSGRTADPLTLGTDGAYLSQPQTRAIRNVTRTFNSQNPRWHWFWPPQFLSWLEGLTDADGRYLADTAILKINDDGRTGVYDGVPFSTTTQIPVNLTVGASSNCTYLVLVDLNNLIIGENTAMELAVSSEASYTPDGGTTWISSFQATQTLFRATLRHDITHRRPNHVLVQTGVRV